MFLKQNHSLKGVLASSVAVLLATTSLSAIPRDPCDPPSPPVCCEEPKPGPFAFLYPFDMNLNCPKDFYFHVDGLALQAKEDGLDFAIQDSSTPSATAPITNGSVAGYSRNNSDYSWNPGIRVGMGFYLDHDAWNLDLNWTWANLTNYQSASVKTANGALIPLWALGAGTPASQIGPKATSRWDVRYNTIDISLGKPHHISRYLVLNPFFGARGGWIYQHYGVHYQGNAQDTGTVNTNDNDFWGLGTRAGLSSDWLLGKGWSLFGNIAFSMLFGKFEIDQHYHVPGESSAGYDLDFDFYQNVPNMELAIGISWGTHFNQQKNHISLKAAYEFHQWWDQLQLRKFATAGTGIVGGAVAGTGIYVNDTVSRGNFTMNGVSLKLQFDI